MSEVDLETRMSMAGWLGEEGYGRTSTIAPSVTSPPRFVTDPRAPTGHQVLDDGDRWAEPLGRRVTTTTSSPSSQTNEK